MRLFLQLFSYLFQTAPSPTAPPPSSCNCGLPGTSGNRIVGGTTSLPSAWPWQVGMVYAGSSQVICGGSLITDRHILTSAHCSIPQTIGNLQVLLGKFDTSLTSDNSLRLNVASKTEHPSYNKATNDFDFAILELSLPVAFTKSVRPACLPSGDPTYAGYSAVATGWGQLSYGGVQPSQLQQVTLQVLQNAACGSYPAGKITANMMCASAQGRDACQGDSGGPLVTARSDGRYELIGVTSWGSGCAVANYPGVFARVTKAMSWIRTRTASAELCRP